MLSFGFLLAGLEIFYNILTHFYNESFSSQLLSKIDASVKSKQKRRYGLLIVKTFRWTTEQH